MNSYDFKDFEYRTCANNGRPWLADIQPEVIQKGKS